MQPALRVAEHHWRQPPKCQPVTIVWDPSLNYLGAASQSKCEILLDPGILEPQDKTTFCRVLAHEWGHLVLGPTYFAATNPEEPDESPDWRNIMFAVIPEHFPPCERQEAPGASSPRASHQTYHKQRQVAEHIRKNDLTRRA